MPDKKNNTSEKGHVISHFKAPTPTILTENDFHLFKYQILHPISICYNKNTRVFLLCIFQLSYCESNTSWLNDITLQSKSHLTPSDTHFLRLKKSMMFTAGKPGWHNGASFFQLALRRSRSRVTNHNKNKTGAFSYLRGSRSFYY